MLKWSALINSSRTRPGRSMWRRVVLSLTVAALLVTAVPATAADDATTLILGVFPRRSPTEMVEMFSPLANYLTKVLGRPVKIETTPDFPSFWRAVTSQRYHLVHFNQYHYVRSHKELGYQVIAKNEEAHKSTMAGVILVRKDAGIQSMADLKGKTIIFGGDRQALVSYVIPTFMLREAGLKPGDYREEFAINPPNVALTVFFRKADAGGSGDILLDMPFVRDKVDVSMLRYLKSSEQVAQLPWAVRADVPPAQRALIQQALLGLKAAAGGSDILKAANLTGIVPATDKEYDYVRNMIRTVMAERY
jgi:phosphonate transport system substrate-binding protein